MTLCQEPAPTEYGKTHAEPENEKIKSIAVTGEAILTRMRRTRLDAGDGLCALVALSRFEF